ncbi:hypothetical protein RN01_30440 [Cupriavidus sp. SHE]|jgi:hypothetical protein|uniref:Uncharacterized protein n=1 Tax=Cupriavidus metallidurans TaxID=119219 RepID=A0A2L0X3I6_9BURK|nr:MULTISPECIES: hypothetical protein [Cupriavidus]AVA34661.1 hypothetical protein C3Z06_14250 [Cupriavidus metallidurans]KWR74528.1 hypothetical protein RN01_30440 [Cupriavidus sp. SHE]QBP12291.1 hypothetical protein DDF84_021305 [Cupriavidus metallidurans]
MDRETTEKLLDFVDELATNVKMTKAQMDALGARLEASDAKRASLETRLASLERELGVSKAA